MQHRFARTVVAAVATSALVAAGFGAPAAAAKKKFVVSIKVSATKADVGSSVKVTGKVSGTGAGKKTIRLQRRLGQGAWKYVASTSTTSKGTYTFRYKIPNAGVQSFRVVAPKGKKRAAGVSSTRKLTGWRWLDLTREPWTVSSSGSGSSVVSVGMYETKSGGPRVGISMTPSSAVDDSVRVSWRLQNCTQFVATYGLEKGWSSTGTVWVSSIGFGDEDSIVVTSAADTTMMRALDPVDEVGVAVVNSAGDFTSVIAASPRAYCSVDRQAVPNYDPK